jgi:hypothetical protein
MPALKSEPAKKAFPFPNWWKPSFSKPTRKITCPLLRAGPFVIADVAPPSAIGGAFACGELVEPSSTPANMNIPTSYHLPLPPVHPTGHHCQ